MMNDASEFISESEEQTFEFGTDFAQRLQPGDIVCLRGELGAGKTTFVKGVAKGLGIESRIMSPTYVVVREHERKVKTQNSKVKSIDRLYHLDLYRLQSEKDVLGIDIKSLIQDKNAVTIIEWPEVAKSLLPFSAWEIAFLPEAETKRKIHVTKHSDTS